MPCGHGCHPEPRALTRGETFDLLLEAILLGGELGEAFYAKMTPAEMARARKLAIENEWTVERMSKALARRDAAEAVRR